MTGDEALDAARHRDWVTDGRHEGQISELLGPRWYGRGEERAIIELDDPPGKLIVIPLASLRVMTPKRHIEWSCPECGASGTVDPVNDVDVAIQGIRINHVILSPNCSRARDDVDKRVVPNG